MNSENKDKQRPDRQDSKANTTASSDLISLLGDGEISAFINAKHSGFDIPKPFETTVTLIDRTYLAGSRSVSGLDDRLQRLNTGDHLTFRHERGFGKDDWAVQVYASKQLLGLIRAHENQVIARLLDAGKRVYGILLDSEHVGQSIRVWIKVCLDD